MTTRVAPYYRGASSSQQACQALSAAPRFGAAETKAADVSKNALKTDEFVIKTPKDHKAANTTIGAVIAGILLAVILSGKDAVIQFKNQVKNAIPTTEEQVRDIIYDIYVLP